MPLHLESLTRRFGEQLALDSVSIHVRDGDCYGFIGHNGAGKTSAMRIALGLQRADSGRVLVDGFDASRFPREARARMGGLIEVPGFHGSFDGENNLVWLAGVQGLPRGVARSEARRLLELVGLRGAGSKPVQAYSHGMRQRLGIAQALLGKPRYVLLDEPTNGLDPQGIAEMRELLRRLVRDEGLTVMLSSHQLHELSDLCNRIGVLHRGKLLVEAETRALLAGTPAAFEVATDDDARAKETLARLGVQSRPIVAGGLTLELGQRTPGEVARALVDGGLQLQRLGAKPPNLEEIYLRFARGEVVVAPVSASEVAVELVAAPRERLAPSRPVSRVFGYECKRLFARPAFAALLALPAAFAALNVLLQHSEASANRELVASGELASTTDVTGFQTVASALNTGLPLLALLLAGIASQALAGELNRGTLRNLLLRPIKRAQAVAGKALAGAAIAFGSYALLAVAAVGVSALAFGFHDLAEILPNGASFPLVAAGDLWPKLYGALATPVLPLIAALSIGFVCGAVARTGSGALGLSIAAMLVLDLSRAVARGFGFEGWLNATYLPSPLGNTSYTSFFADLAQGISNTTYEFGRPLLEGAALPAWLARPTAPDVVVPLVWIVVPLVLSAILLARRPIP